MTKGRKRREEKEMPSEAQIIGEVGIANGDLTNTVHTVKSQ